MSAAEASGPIINLLISFLLGLSVGTGIIISQSFGAKNWERLQQGVDTIVTITLLLSLLLSAVGIPLSARLLGIVQTPPEVIQEGTIYLQVTFGGILFLILSNVMSGIFQGIGDSLSSFVFLAISCVINIVLDLLFVIVFHWGVTGTALATLIAQACSVLFAFFKINRRTSPVHFTLRNFHIYPELLKRILQLGLPSGFQNALSSLGGVIISALLNSFGRDVIAANVAVIKIDSFAIMPMMTLGSAISVYVGQNMGASKPERIHEGVRKTLMVSFLISAVISVFLFFFGSLPMSLFTPDSTVIQLGVDKFVRMAPFYFMLGLYNVLSGAARGRGHTIAPMLIGILSIFVVQFPSALLLSRAIGVNGIHWSKSICWTMEALSITVYYLCAKLHRDGNEGKV